MPRIIDLLAVLAVAVVLLLPKASVTAQPALAGDPIELDRLAELQNERYRHPGDVDAALRLGDAFLSAMRSDWTLATLAQFSSGSDYRVHLLLATAYAERLEAKQAVDEGALVEKLCEAAQASPPCPPGVPAKVGLIRQSMQVLLDGNIDPAKDPQRARDAVARVLHSSKFLTPVKPPVPAPPK